MLEYRNVATSDYTLGGIMRRVIGSLLITVTVIIGLYLGIYLAFIDGVIQIIDGVKTTPVNVVDVVWGLVRVVILPASTAFTTWFIVVATGGMLLDWDQTESVRLDKVDQYH